MESLDDNWPTKPSNYSLKMPIGRGSYGLVWNAVCTCDNNKHNGSEVAVKIVNMEMFADGNLDEIRKEIKIMSQNRHQSVISYYASFEDDSDLWMVMPLLNAGSVEDILERNFPQGVKDEKVIATILKDIVAALDYFHQHD